MDCVVKPVLVDSEDGLHILRHSAAHIMALAVRKVFGEGVKVAIGPAIEDGFYYDFDCPEPFHRMILRKLKTRWQRLLRPGFLLHDRK